MGRRRILVSASTNVVRELIRQIFSDSGRGLAASNLSAYSAELLSMMEYASKSTGMYSS